MIKVNQAKATEITKDAIREYRKPLLEALDVAFIRSAEEGTDSTQIKADKQILRDMPSTADGKSVNELKTLIDGLVK